jgi:hypothetical protein
MGKAASFPEVTWTITGGTFRTLQLYRQNLLHLVTVSDNKVKKRIGDLYKGTGSKGDRICGDEPNARHTLKLYANKVIENN